ncbi:MAG: DUF6084 family protein [Thermoleophilaceae bacterium]
MRFSIEDGGVLPHSAVPTLRFGLRVESDEEVRALSLGVQVRIAATQRTYSDAEEEALRELFGSPEQWGRSLQSLHWTNLAVQVPAFSGSTLVDLLMTCTYDLEVTAAKYLTGLEDGEVPLEFLFGGTLFYGDPLQARPISWDAEAGYRLPVSVWREMMDRFFPNSAWLRLDRRTFDRLHAYRARNAYLNWDDTFEALLG